MAAIYKDRWQMELFFKALKQNLRIKTFVGTSANAVQTQVWTALIAMLVLKYLQLKSRFSWSLSNLAALLRINLFFYRDLWRWLDEPFAATHLARGGTDDLCVHIIRTAQRRPGQRNVPTRPNRPGKSGLSPPISANLDSSESASPSPPPNANGWKLELVSLRTVPHAS